MPIGNRYALIRLQPLLLTRLICLLMSLTTVTSRSALNCLYRHSGIRKRAATVSLLRPQSTWLDQRRETAVIRKLQRWWRRGWDSNPRSSYPDYGFRDRPIRPLSHLSSGPKGLAVSHSCMTIGKPFPKQLAERCCRRVWEFQVTFSSIAGQSSKRSKGPLKAKLEHTTPVTDVSAGRYRLFMLN